MEQQEILELEEGTKEIELLKPEKVKIVKVTVEAVGVGEKKNNKLICSVQHSGNEDPIQISRVKYEVKETLKTVGLWVNLDEDNKIRKKSALSVLMNFLNVKKPKELEGKEIETITEDTGYLCLKAY
ncbi:MAG: hypothetical protein QQN41_08690 [Nitrosopumilus sp.]